MDNILSDLVAWLDQLPPSLVYLAILSIAFAENVLPPVPGDLVIVFAGYLVGLDRLGFSESIIVSSVGGVLGFMAMFAIGRRMGVAVLSPERFRWLPKRRIRVALERVSTYGYWIVLANRFLPGLRSVISIASGMSAIRVAHTWLAAFVSSIAWSWLMVLSGKHLGENWGQVSVWLRRYSIVFLSIVVVVIVVQVVRYRKAREIGGGE